MISPGLGSALQVPCSSNTLLLIPQLGRMVPTLYEETAVLGKTLTVMTLLDK